MCKTVFKYWESFSECNVLLNYETVSKVKSLINFFMKYEIR